MTDVQQGGDQLSPWELVQIADSQKRLLIPCVDALHNAILEQIPFPRDADIRILDLGAGDGYLSGLLLAYWPNASISAFDRNSAVLERAKARFDHFNSKLETEVGDFRNFDFFGPYDVIVSSLAIHNATDPEKGGLFQYCFSQLNPGGCFIVADRVKGPTPQGEQWYQTAWTSQIRTAGASGELIAHAERKMKKDHCAPLVDQLLWLSLGGFERVDCWYKSYQFAVFGGHKPAAATRLP